VHLPDAPDAADWTAKSPAAQPVRPEDVNVIAAASRSSSSTRRTKKTVVASLTSTISGGGGGFFREESQYGEGTCVEHGDSCMSLTRPFKRL